MCVQQELCAYVCTYIHIHTHICGGSMNGGTPIAGWFFDLKIIGYPHDLGTSHIHIDIPQVREARLPSDPYSEVPGRTTAGIDSARCA